MSDYRSITLSPNNVDFWVTVKRIILLVFPLVSQISRSARQELNVLAHSGTCGEGKRLIDTTEVRSATELDKPGLAHTRRLFLACSLSTFNTNVWRVELTWHV